MSKIYNIRFRNLTRRPVQLYEGRAVLKDLLPGATIDLECTSASSTYSRWDEVDFTIEGVRLHQRRDWNEPRPPAGFVSVEFLNKEGEEIEMREVAGTRFYLPRGIPVRVFIPQDDPLSRAKRVEVRWADERVKSDFHIGYYGTKRILRDCIVPR